MSILTWREADSPRDRKHLQAFRCTSEELRMELTPLGLTPEHSRLWEWQVQTALQDLRVPKGRAWSVRMGFDETGVLGGVLASQELALGEHYDLTYGAVACHLRGQGGATADEMLADHIENAILPRCVEVGREGEVRVSGIVHRKNLPSQQMVRRNGFNCDGPTSRSDDYEDWSMWVPIPQPELFSAPDAGIE